MTIRLLAAGAAFAWAFSSFAATEYFADAVNGNDGYDGLSETWTSGTHGPKKTVQAAVDLAVVGSTKSNRNTVTLLPGDYDIGERAVTSGGVVSSNRVVITAPILLRSKNGRASRDTTRIVGKWDLSDESDVKYFMGPRAVRCVWVENGVIDGTRLVGLTFLRGCAPWGGDGADHTHATGGGGVVFNGYTDTRGLVIDCAFVECIGTRGAGMYNGSAVRCLFTRCRASKFGTGARNINAYNCVFDCTLQCPGASEGSAALSYSYQVVNCTFVGNQLYGMSAKLSDQPCNCVFFKNAGGSVVNEFSPTNCVMDGTLPTKGLCTAATATELFSPATGDWRLTAGAAATTAGDAQWLAKIPEEFRGTDYYGNPRTNEDGMVYAGAVQATAVPVGGMMSAVATSSFDSNGHISCNGHVCTYGTLYEQGETWPRSVKFGWQKTPGMTVDRGLVYYLQDSTTVQWPLMDDTAWIVAPAAGSTTAVFCYTAPCLHIDPVNGSDAAPNDGSAELPWRTLQKAVDRSNSNGQAVIVAEPGDYKEGETYFLGCSNRVHVTTTSSLRVKARAGAATTFITGAPDETEPLDGKGWGIGSNAVRCVSVADGTCCAFQGFTLREGRGSMIPNNKDSHAARGAAFLNGLNTMNYKTGRLLDCVVTNCYGSRGPAAYGGICERTLFVDCHTSGLGTFRYADLRSCVVKGMADVTGGVLADVSQAYNTTFYGHSGAAIGNAHAYNCVAGGSTTDLSVVSDRTYASCVARKITSSSGIPPTCVKEDPYFKDAANGDFRLVSGSAGTWLGSRTYLQSAMDFYGRPFAFGPNGEVRTGAIDELAPGVRLETQMGAVGSNDVQSVSTEGLHVAGVPYKGRNCLTIVLNGATQTVGTVEADISLAMATSVVPYVVQFVYPTHFYVDATNGNDTAAGVSPETAWKTLAFASTNAVFAGDVVTVLPGEYDQDGVYVPASLHNYTGENTPCCVLTRLVAWPGVTFESRDGAASTIVKGAKATGTVGVDCDTRGMGANAVKCAFVSDNATVRGFTFRGGRSHNGMIGAGGKDIQFSGYMAAGVMGPCAGVSGLRELCPTRIVQDCVIEDCVAPRGGAARHVTLSNCTIRACGGQNMGAIVRESMLYNCVLSRNLATNGSNFYYDLKLWGCTFLADNDADTVSYSNNPPFGRSAVNCAFCKKASLHSIAFTNCAFASGMKLSKQSEADFSNVNPITGITDFQLDAEGRPLAGSPLVDAGARDYAVGETDCGGGQRIYNGAVDIGAFEYDVRGDFARTLGSRKLAIDALDCDATTNTARQVVLSKGSLDAIWTSPAAGVGAPYSFVAQMTGTGTLTVMREGDAEPLAVVTATTAQTVFTFTSPNQLTKLSFVYEPGDNDTGSALLSRFTHRLGTTIIVR